jgi:uncharacterized protein YwqG
LRNANKDAWCRFLQERKLDPTLAATWSSYAKPNIRLIPLATLDGDKTKPGTSKLGGAPDLPIGAPWPARPPYLYSRNHRDFLPEVAWQPQPLTFLAQINLSEVAKVGCDLPLMCPGLLLFFYDVETLPFGHDPLDAPGAQVLFVGADTPTRRQAHSQFGSHRVQPLRFLPEEGLPGWEWVLENHRDQPGYGHGAFQAELDKLSDEDWQVIAPGGHVFGGWPNNIQGPMELDCEKSTTSGDVGSADGYADSGMPDLRRRAREWRLLLQLDSDDDLGWSWGDEGMIYFWCREGDIARQRFDRGWTMLQYMS